MAKLIQFLKEVREEFKNITWPKREALIQLVVVVISISIVISLILGGFDYIFTNSFSYISSIKTTNTTTKPEAFPTFGLPASPSATPKTTTKPTIIKNVKK